MKKGFQKVLVLLLTLSMLMSMMAVPGFAADELDPADQTIAAEAASDEASLADGTYNATGLRTAVLNMYHFHDPQVVVKGDQAWLLTTEDTDVVKRYDGMAYGPQSQILDAADTTNHTLVEGTPTATVVPVYDDDGTLQTRTFVLPVPKSVIEAGGDIYYMIKYKDGYSEKHDGDWYKASGGDYYLTGYTLEKVSDATALPGEETPDDPEPSEDQKAVDAFVEQMNATDWYSWIAAGEMDVEDILEGDVDEVKAAVLTPYDALTDTQKELVPTEMKTLIERIREQVASLEEPAVETIELVPTNEELMFKVVNAYIEKNGDKTELVFALSGSGYEDVIAGTYDDAMAAQVGASHDNWIHGAKADVNCDYWTERAIDNPPVNHYEEGVQNKWQFRVPVELPASGTVKVPVVAVSKSRYQKAEKADAENPDYSSAFTSRQFVIDVDAKTVRTGNLSETFDVTVASNVKSFAVAETGSLHTVGTPAANEYTCQPTITMNDKVYDKAFLGTKEEAAADGAKTIELGEDQSFVLGFFNTLGGKQHIVDGKAVAAFHVAADAPYAEKDTWVERTFTIDLENKTITIDGDELTEETPDELTDGTYTASKVSTDVTTEASGMIMVTKATVVIKDGQATAIVTMKGTGADRFYVSDTATADTIIAEAVAEEQKEVNGEFAGLLGGLKMEGESAYTFWPIPIKLGEPKVYAARSASHFSKQDLAPEKYYYVHDFQIDAADLEKISDSTELPITEQQEAQRYLNQYFMDGKVVTADTAASVKGKDAKVTIPYYDKENNKISSFIFKMAESDKFRSGWFVDSSILNSTYFSSSNLKKIRYPEGANGKVTFNPKAAYRDEGMTFTATLKLYPADAEYNQYDADGGYYDKEPLAEQTFTFTVEPLPGDRHVTIDVIDAVSKEPVEGASVTVTKDADSSAVEVADGTYALTVPGTYTIKASAEGYLVPGTEETEYIQTEYAPKKDGETLKIELIKAEESKDTITFDLKDQMGEAVVNPAITVYPWSDKEAVVAPEADGSYKLYHGIRYGYTIKADGYEETTKSMIPVKDDVEEVLVNKYLTEQKFTFKVYDKKTNETLDGVTVTVKYGPSGADKSTFTEAQPDEKGVYTIPIDNQVIAYGHKIGYKDDELGVWSLGFDPQKDCSFGLEAYPALTVDKANAGMMKPAEKAYLTGEKTVLLPMENDSFTAISIGEAAKATDETAIALSEENTFTFDVEEFDKEMTIAFKSKKNGNWLNKKVTVSKENGMLVIVDDKADYAKVDAAKAAIPEDLSIYTEASVKAVNDAVAAVKTGKNSAEQDAVDAMAKAIDDAVAALKVKNGWILEDGEWAHYTDGVKLVNGWAKDSHGWCWLDGNGKITKDKWIKDNGEWYYLKANGYMAANEWAKDSHGWCWMAGNGKITKSRWIQDKGEWYYLKADGYMAASEWAKDSHGWCWMAGNGKITKSSWLKYGGSWYYLKADGYMATGRQTINGKAYTFNASGKLI